MTAVIEILEPKHFSPKNFIFFGVLFYNFVVGSYQQVFLIVFGGGISPVEASCKNNSGINNSEFVMHVIL
jgi:hypothetical protein